MVWVVWLLVLQGLACTQASGAKASKELQIEHAMRVEGLSPVFSKRGVIKQRGTAVAIEQDALTEEAASDLVNAANSGGYYFVRIPVSSENNQTEWASTLVKACTLVSSKLRDQLTLHYSPQTESIVGLTYAMTNYTCANKAYINRIVEGATFKTTVVVNTKGRPGPVVVLTAEAQQEQEQLKQKAVQLDDEGNPIPPPPEPGFLSKYWMYIVPALLLFNTMMTPAPQGPAAGGQRGRAGPGQQ